MHLGILFSQGILFFDLIVLQAIFFDVARVAGLARATCPPGTGGKQMSLASPIVAAGLLVSWTVGVEYYPMTSWQIYSHHVSSNEVRHWKISAQRADGRGVVIQPDEWIGAVTDCRYRDYFFRGRHETSVFMKALGRRANLLIEDSAAKLVSIKLETWSRAIAGPDKAEGDRLLGSLQIRLHPE